MALVATPFIQPFTAKAATDSSVPVVSITAPANGATVSGTVSINANASDVFSPCVVTLFGKQYDVQPLKTGHPGGNIFVCGTDMTTIYQGQHGTNVTQMQPYLIPTTYVGVSKVEFYVDGVLKGTDTVSPYSYSWNTSGVANGSHTIQAKAYDGTNIGSSAMINVTVNNVVTPPPTTTPDVVAPTVSITSPAPSSTVSSTVQVNANASDNVGITKVEFYLNNGLVSMDSLAPYSFAWNTKTVSSGIHSLLAKAYDAAGNIGTSTLVSVTVTSTSYNPPMVCRDDDDDDDDDDHEFKDWTAKYNQKLAKLQAEYQKKLDKIKNKLSYSAAKKQKKIAELDREFAKKKAELEREYNKHMQEKDCEDDD